MASDWSHVASLHLHAETSATSTMATQGVVLKKNLILILVFMFN